jgi:hypothetical protein
MRNPYEPTLDSFGNLFISDNDDDGNENTRINYVMEGGNYGYWPHRKGDLHLESVHWNMDQPGVVPRMIRTGFGSPCGMLTYEGRSMPERIWNALIHAEAGPGEIRAYYPRPDGAGFAADQEVLLRCENDSWFRPVDVAVAPDGSIFVADWYDPGVGGHRMGDVIRGRVYRLTDAATRSTGYKVPPLDLTSEAGFREALASPNVARRFLAYFAFEMHSTDFARSLLRDEDPMVRARALWPASGNPFLRHEGFEAASKNESVFERVQAVRAIARAHPAALLAYPQLLTDKSPQVRRQLLLELARAPYDVALPGKAILPNGAPGNANLPIGLQLARTPNRRSTRSGPGTARSRRSIRRFGSLLPRSHRHRVPRPRGMGVERTRLAPRRRLERTAGRTRDPIASTGRRRRRESRGE